MIRRLWWTLASRLLLGLDDRIRDLERSIQLAENMVRDQQEHGMKITRVLLSADQRVTVTGTQDEIDAAARRMARLTRSCVSVAVVVSHYHRRGCGQRPQGGFEVEGN